MKIFVSYPPLEGKGTPLLGQNRQFQWFHNPSFIYPMVPASAATLLKSKGHDVTWDDGIARKWSSDKWWENILAAKPDLIAMETKTPVVKLHWKIADRIKEELPGTIVILMGDHITAFPDKTMEQCRCDYAITGGDYDFLLANIVDHIANGENLEPGIWYRENGSVKNTGQFRLDHDLNELPMVDRELTDWRLYGEPLYKREPFTYTMVGRDCPWAKCTFCSWTTLYPKFRTRTPESLLDEIGMLIDTYGVREIFDDTGSFPPGGWLDRFCKGMIQRGYNRKIRLSINFRFDYLQPKRAALMREAGFRLMKLGLESTSQETLDRLDKGTEVGDIERGCRIAKDAGLEVHLTIMVGYPWETRADAERTLNLAKKLMKDGLADMLQSTIAVPYPGTPLYRQAVENDWLRFAPDDYEKFDMTAPVFKTPDMTPEEVVELCNSIYRTFLQPSYIWRYIKSIRTPADVKFIAKGAKAVVGHLMDFTKKR
ncbi:MAG: radical SAM protein [Candidatus Latescibacteria bacterium]|nr:radical SAM protein [Candidatus Latescibacterota bacterium]